MLFDTMISDTAMRRPGDCAGGGGTDRVGSAQHDWGQFETPTHLCPIISAFVLDTLRCADQEIVEAEAGQISADSAIDSHGQWALRRLLLDGTARDDSALLQHLQHLASPAPATVAAAGTAWRWSQAGAGGGMGSKGGQEGEGAKKGGARGPGAG